MTKHKKSDEILFRYASGERDFRNLNLDDRTYNFDNSNLRGAVFTGGFLLASFRNADLEGADFSNCNLKTSDFSGAKLSGATFSGSAIDAADFNGADLRGTDFEGASAYGRMFSKSELP